MKKEKNKQITTEKLKDSLNIGELFNQLKNGNCGYKNNTITLLPIEENIKNISKYICELYNNPISKEKKKEAMDYFRKMIKNGYYNVDKSLLRGKKGIEVIFTDVFKYLKDLADNSNIIAIEEFLFILEKCLYDKIKSDTANSIKTKIEISKSMRKYSSLGCNIHRENINIINCIKENKEESKNDKEEKVRLIKSFVDNKNTTAMFHYAFALEEGKDIEQNKEEAAKYFKMAADRGDIDAIFVYISMLYEGDGIEQDVEKGEKYLKMAVDSGNADAIYYFACMLYNGEYIKQNKKEAAKYFKIAIEKGNIKAISVYASILYNGDGIKKNKKKAIEYFKLAADKGNVYAMVDYARVLYDGKNNDEAIKYFKMAADKGNVEAIDIYTDILDENDYDVNTLIKYIKLMKNTITNLNSVI